MSVNELSKSLENQALSGSLNDDQLRSYIDLTREATQAQNLLKNEIKEITCKHDYSSGFLNQKKL